MEWTPRHKTTARTESLIRKLADLAREIDDGLLQAASIDARWEWNVLCEAWPSAADMHAGVIGLSDDELDAMIGKVMRFKSILVRISGGSPKVPHAPVEAVAA
jgi:hypothetical protein